MNPAVLRSKRVTLPAVAVVALLGTGATLRTATAGDELRGSERDRVARAAVQAVGGTVIEVEAGDEAGQAYEVEVRTDDGTEVDVALDRDLNVVSREVDDGDDAADEADHDGDDHADDDGDDGGDDGDRALTASQRASAGKAALSAVGGGTVVEVEAGDEGTEAYEVEVRAADGTEWDVRLDVGYRVLSKTADD